MDNERNEAVQAQPEQAAEVRSERPAQRPFNRRRKKVCTFCADKIDHIDYKDINRLKKCVSDRAKILPRRISGACAKHQREVNIAIKRARQAALLPFICD